MARGEPFDDRMRAARVDEDDVLGAARRPGGPAARRVQGLEWLGHVEYTVLGQDGGVSVIPARPVGGG